jgi:hypothetical protein
VAYDLSLYYATIDSPSGPLYSPIPEPGSDFDHIARDDDGNPTHGGLIGDIIATVILFGMFLYMW